MQLRKKERKISSMKKNAILLFSCIIISCNFQNVEYDVTSQQIYNEFSENEVAALSKYKGKKIRVTGELLSFINTFGSNYCYIGSHGDLIGEIECKMSDEFSKNAGNYKIGQTITLEGIVVGKTFTGVVQIQ
jgi:hypothetical protein